MTGTTRSSDGLDIRRKRLLFRCWHRGTREMDLILGRFADAEIATLSDDEMSALERLIEVPDPDLYAALTGDRRLAFQAVMMDPLTAAVCDLWDIQKMVDEMFRKQRRWLPQFS